MQRLQKKYPESEISTIGNHLAESLKIHQSRWEVLDCFASLSSNDRRNRWLHGSSFDAQWMINNHSCFFNMSLPSLCSRQNLSRTLYHLSFANWHHQNTTSRTRRIGQWNFGGRIGKSQLWNIHRAIDEITRCRDGYCPIIIEFSVVVRQGNLLRSSNISSMKWRLRNSPWRF